MKKTLIATAVVLGFAVVVAAQPLSLWNINDARMATKLEIQVDEAGVIQEIEYHIDPFRFDFDFPSC